MQLVNITWRCPVLRLRHMHVHSRRPAQSAAHSGQQAGRHGRLVEGRRAWRCCSRALPDCVTGQAASQRLPPACPQHAPVENEDVGGGRPRAQPARSVLVAPPQGGRGPQQRLGGPLCHAQQPGARYLLWGGVPALQAAASRAGTAGEAWAQDRHAPQAACQADARAGTGGSRRRLR